MKVDNIFVRLASLFGIDHIDNESATKGDVVFPTDFECLGSLIKTYSDSCGKLSDYDLQYTSYFVEACESLGNTYALQLLVKTVCSTF